MSSNEQETLSAIFDLAGGAPTLVTLDELADRLGTTLAMTKTNCFLLRGRGLVVVTFGGVQLTASGLAFADSVREEV